MSESVYSSGQLEVIYPFLSEEPQWLVLGGPTDGNEAQCARRKWPDIRVLGIEPSQEARTWQLANGWPQDAPILNNALWDRDDEATLAVWVPGHLRNTKVIPEPKELDISLVGGYSREKVVPITLDTLDLVLGPFQRAILWLDIECSEYRALLGARKLLESGRVILVNVEEMVDWCTESEKIEPLLSSYGYRAVHEWNASATCRDRIYVKEI